MLKDLLVPAKELAVVKNFNGTNEMLGTAIRRNVWNERLLPDAVILGVTDPRASEVGDVQNSPDTIREQLYSLQQFSDSFTIVDLGNVITGRERGDTFSALRMVAEELIPFNLPVLILGSGQYFASAVAAAFTDRNPVITIIDDRIDNTSFDGSCPDDLFVNNLPAESTINFMGVQSYFIPFNARDMVSSDYNGTLFSLGEIRKRIKETEPHIRESDLVCFDYCSMRLSDAPGQWRNSPNGFNGEEICQLAWYAGIATQNVWFMMSGYSPKLDPARNGAMINAHIAWYYLQGISKKIDQKPQDEAIDFHHFMVNIDGITDPVTFLRHPVSKRWWMEVPSPDCDLFPLRVPCSKNDYKRACRNEIPERWWAAFNRTY